MLKEKVEKRIRELVPELMELSFGCEVKINYDDGCEPDSLVGVVTWTRDNGAYTKDDHMKMTVSCIGDCYTDDDSVEIIGHPIHLEHVLLAVEKSVGDFEVNTVPMNVIGFGDYSLKIPIFTVCSIYNLSLPFSEQPDEVYELLGEILKVNK